MKIYWRQRLGLQGLGVFILCACNSVGKAPSDSPHIVIFMADDLGWNDVGYRDPEMATPNVDRLASEGVNLTYSYMQQVCTPSRGAFLTGKYPFRMSLQHSVFSASRDNSLPLGIRLLSEHIKDLGYDTHFIGKWHLGFCNQEMTPTYRGFDTFYGMYNGKADYFSHISKKDGYDLQDNKGKGSERDFQVAWSGNGTYSTHLFTRRAVEILESHNQSKPIFLFLSYQAVHGPLQVPEYYVHKYCANVSTGHDRKTHCAMTAAMDEGIGNVTSALDSLGFSDNLITLFISDNGGPVSEASSNWPLRGSKITLWEGGTRVVTILHSKKYLPNTPRVWPGLMHAVDWYPTLVRAAGDETAITGIDGVDNWNSIVNNSSSRRTEFVYNIDDVKDSAAIRVGRYKLLHNPTKPDGWYNPPAGLANRTQPSGKYPEYLLFDIEADPEEVYDISESSGAAETLNTMKAKLEAFKSQLVPSTQGAKVEEGNPKLYGGAWVSGWCEVPSSYSVSMALTTESKSNTKSLSIRSLPTESDSSTRFHTGSESSTRFHTGSESSTRFHTESESSIRSEVTGPSSRACSQSELSRYGSQSLWAMFLVYLIYCYSGD